MLKRTIKYTDFNDNEVEEEFYFNMSKSELVEMEVSYKDGFKETLERIIATDDNAALIKEFKKIILLSYGIKSEDGKRFEKSDEIRKAFSQSSAYNELFMELATNDGLAAEFINGVMPRSLMDEVVKEAGVDPSAENALQTALEASSNVSGTATSPTQEELAAAQRIIDSQNAGTSGI